MIRILLSLAMIAITLVGVSTATSAYFSHGEVLGNNTFSTGSVILDQSNFQGFPLTFLNLAPGVQVSKDVHIQYTGTLNADIYVGARGTSHPGELTYFADKTNMIIRQGGVGDWYNGLVSGLSTTWVKVASNVAQNQWLDYTLFMTLDLNTPNEFQGKTNSDTELLFYSVQTGNPAPTTVPWTTTGNVWN
jgi:hypothetical protein